MRIHRLTLRNFRGIAERTVPFAASGVTIVQGDNEAGKTSLVEALDLLLDYRDDSQAKAVRATKPVGTDLGAFVEAELSAGPYRFTYAKQFHRDRGTTLHVHEPAVEQYAGREAHERVHAILDEHVDRQLWTALRLHQGVELDQADLSEGTSLAAALDAAAGAGLGSERESSVFARVRAEYERFYTPRAGRPTRLLINAAEEERRALERADALSTELDALDADVERDRVLQHTIADRRAALTAGRERVRATEASARAAESRAAEAERLRLEAELAEAARRHAAEAVDVREALKAERSELAVQGTRLGAAAEAAEENVASAQERALLATTRTAEAEAALEEGRERLREAEEAREVLLLHDQLDALLDRHARAAAALEEIRAADAVVESLAVDDDVLAAIEDAERAAVAAEAALGADATLVRVRSLLDTAVTVDDGVAETVRRGAEREHRVVDALTLRIGEFAEVEVVGSAPARARAEHHASVSAALVQRCRENGVADPDAARQVHRERREALTASTNAGARLEAVLAGTTLAALEDRIATVRLRVGAAPRGGIADADAAEDLVRDARKKLLEAEDLAADAIRARDQARDDAAALRAEADRLRHEVRACARRRLDVDAALTSARAQCSDRGLEAALTDAAAAALAAHAAYGEAERSLGGTDPAEARAEADAANALADALAAELRAAEDERRDVRSRLELRGEQGLHDAFERARGDQEHAAREHRRLQAQATAARLLYERMAANRDAARRAYAAPLREKLERLGRIVFGDGLRIELDEDLRIARRTLGEVTLDYDQLSSGAREQLAVLARLAVAAIVGRDGGVPLILDDALGYSDPGRLERLGAALRVGARDTQVIVLTCVPERYRHVGQASVVRL